MTTACDLQDTRKPFDKASHERSSVRLNTVRPKLLQYIQRMIPEARFYALDDYCGGLRYQADLRLFDDNRIIGHLEDEVRFTANTVHPHGMSLHVPNRPNKVSTADFYVQYHVETPFFWVAPVSELVTWGTSVTQAFNADDLERFLTAPTTAVDWYLLTREGAEPYDVTHQYLERWLKHPVE